MAVITGNDFSGNVNLFGGREFSFDAVAFGGELSFRNDNTVAIQGRFGLGQVRGAYNLDTGQYSVVVGIGRTFTGSTALSARSAALPVSE